MLSIRELETVLQRVEPRLRDIVFELRNLVAEVEPEANEIIRRFGLSYCQPGSTQPVYRGICNIGLESDHVRLEFNLGVFLPDPQHLLTGDRKAKRFVRIYNYEEAPWDDLKALIDAAARFDPYTQTFRPRKD
jgi:hypothetical protein